MLPCDLPQTEIHAEVELLRLKLNYKGNYNNLQPKATFKFRMSDKYAWQPVSLVVKDSLIRLILPYLIGIKK